MEEDSPPRRKHFRCNPHWRTTWEARWWRWMCVSSAAVVWSPAAPIPCVSLTWSQPCLAHSTYSRFDCEANANAAKYFDFRIRCWTPSWTRTFDYQHLFPELRPTQFDRAMSYVNKCKENFLLSFKTFVLKYRIYSCRSCFNTLSVLGVVNNAGGGGNGSCISWARLAARFANSCMFTYIGCWSWWVANSIS